MSDTQRTPRTTGGAFESLTANPDYAKLWWSGLVAFLAVGMQMLARGWLATELTGSNSSFGAVLFAFGIGMVVCNPFGGVAADRYSRRAIILWTHLTLTLSALWLGIMVLADREQFWMLLLVSLIQGASFAFMGPARVALTGEVVEREFLANAVSLTQFTVSGTQIFGPALAGVLIATPGFGMGGVYMLSAGLTAVGALPVLRLPVPRTRTRVTRGPLEEMAEAVTYVWRHPYLRIVVSTTFLLVMVALPFQAFLVKFAESVLGVGALWAGIMQGAGAVGGTFAAVYVARQRDNRRLWRLRTVGGALMVAGVLTLAVSPNVGVALVVLLPLGAGAMAFQSANMSMSLLLAEPVYHGRVQSLTMAAFSAQSLVSLPLGALADVIGLREMYALMAAAGALVVLLGVTATRRARLDR